MAVLGSWVTDVLVAITVILLVYYYRKSASKRNKYPFIKHGLTFREFLGVMLGKRSFVEAFNDFYPQFKAQGYGGIHGRFGNPIMIICGPDLVKQVLTKDFNTFHDRGMPYDDKKDPFSANLVNLGGQRWKTVRSKLSPTFTSGKIKTMFPLIQECAKELKECIQVKIKEQNGSVEMKNILVRFCTDVIGTCAFGIQCNSLKNSNNEFYLASRDIFRNSIGSVLRSMLINAFPKLQSYLTFKRQFPTAVNFFNSTIEQTVKFRRENNVERNDFVQQMMKVNEEDESSFSLETMVANAIIFFFAGLDNIAQTVGFCLHEMALNPELQEKVYEEIETVLEAHKGELSYESLGNMELVGRVIDEGLRKYTPAGILIRKQTEEKFEFPDSDIVTEKGMVLMVPVSAIHHDPEYYPDPEKFDPDRFTEEEKQKRHPYVYLPFGEGPRFCIASRFALLEVRLCFAELMRSFEFKIAPETDLTLEMDPRAPGLSPKKGFWLTVSERGIK